MKRQRRSSDWCVELAPAARIVVGGYDASLAPQAYTDVDFVVRGEGKITFRELLRAIETTTATSP